jgi:hypothetical protein
MAFETEKDPEHRRQLPDLWQINPWLTAHMIGAAHSQCIEPAEQERGRAMVAALAKPPAMEIVDVGQEPKLAADSNPR